MRKYYFQNKSYKENGFILFVNLLLILLGSFLTLSLLHDLRASKAFSTSAYYRMQAWNTARSAAWKAIIVAQQEILTGLPSYINNPMEFKHQFLCNMNGQNWYYTIYIPGYTVGDPIQYSLSDEAAKKYVPGAVPLTIADLCAIDTPTAEALIYASLLDEEPFQSPSESGTEDDYNNKKKPKTNPLPVAARKAGLTDQDLEGTDYNETIEGLSNSYSSSSSGGSIRKIHLITTYSYEPNVSNDGRPRINLNDPNLDIDLLTDLPQATRIYLKAMRANGLKLSHVAELLEASNTFKDESGKNITLSSGISANELPLLLDRYTATADPYLIGLINIHTAPAEILQTLPHLNKDKVIQIINTRINLQAQERKTPAWLYTRGITDASSFIKIAPAITTRSYQFRFRVIVYCLPARYYNVMEIMIDLATPKPSIVYMRDLTRLGLPIPLDQIIN